MKTADQINEARKFLSVAAMTIDPLGPQYALLSGMINALCWVVDSPHGSTLERLLAGEPIAHRTAAEDVVRDWRKKACP
jgi:hypothetical protein